MTDTKNDVDRLIRDALDREDAELFDRLGAPSMFEQITDLFRGQNRWLTLLGVLGTLVFMGLGIYCAVRFLGTENVPEMLRWGVGLLFCAMAVLLGKIWAWMEMQRHTLTREIKRLELQLVHLAEK